MEPCHDLEEQKIHHDKSSPIVVVDEIWVYWYTNWDDVHSPLLIDNIDSWGL